MNVTYLMKLKADRELTKILRTHAAVGVIGHGLLRGAGLGGLKRG
jgi:uncharacterized protein YaaW (UPF0174 family)